VVGDIEVFTYLTWEEQHIVAEHSAGHYIIFVSAILIYLLCYVGWSDSKCRSMALFFCPVVVLFVSALEFANLVASREVSIQFRTIDFLTAVLLMPPTNAVLVYCAWRNFRALLDPNRLPIGWSWFVALIVVHVPLSAITLSLAEPSAL
jgi:hypothetical protein